MSFGCKYNTTGNACRRLGGECRPGTKGCVLAGLYEFPFHDDPPKNSGADLTGSGHRYAETLREEQDLFFTLNAIGDALISTDPEGVITRVNPAAERLLAKPFTDLVGMPLHDVLPLVETEGGRRIKEPLDALLYGELGSARSPVGLPGNVTLRTDDNKTYRLKISAEPIRDGRRRVIGAVLVLRDVTAEHETRLKLMHSEAQQSALIEAMTQGLALHEVIYDDDGRPVDYTWVSVNPAYERLTGLRSDLILGRRVTEVLPDVEQYWIDTFCAVAVEGEAIEYENYTAPLDKWFYTVVYRPEPGHFAVIITDISDRKRVEAEREHLLKELEAKNAELERFVYTVSHDLKSPLITIKGFAGMIQQDLSAGTTGSLQDDIGRICSAADHMDTLLGDLLELSRVGRVVNPPEMVCFAEIAKAAELMLHGTLATKNICVEIEDDLPMVYGDRTRLIEVVQNLIENAIKFMGEQAEPKINIGARSEDDQVVMFIRDNGSGIHPDYLERVFGLFEQLDPQIEGSGMGLALIKRIMEIHGGEVWVESEGEGKGSCFYFTLPHAPKAETSQ